MCCKLGFKNAGFTDTCISVTNYNVVWLKKDQRRFPDGSKSRVFTVKER